MLARLLKGLGKAAVLVLAALGLLAVVAVWAVAGWFKSWGEPIGSGSAFVDRGAVVKQGQNVGGGQASCECNNGALCQGPQGGAYCITPEGKKRYKKVQ